MSIKIKIAIIQNILPSYRKGFYDIILNNPKYEITIYCHDKVNFLNIPTVHERYRNIKLIKYYSIRKHHILLQLLPFFELKNNYDILIFDGNPRHTTQLLYSTIFRFLGKKVVISSSAHSRRNHHLSIALRQKWWKIFKYFML